MRELFRAPIRASAFLTKEILEILRQPRLVLTLVLGPFLILLLVGIGYRNQPRVLRTLFVANTDATAEQVEAYAENLSPNIIFAGVTRNEGEAGEQLRRGEVDLVVVAPINAEGALRRNEQAIFEVYHNEIDPVQASYVDFMGQFYVEEVNRRVLRALTEQTQTEATTVQEDVAAARPAAGVLREAMERSDGSQARDQQRSLDSRLDALDLAVGASAGVLASVAQASGGAQDPQTATILEKLAETRSDSDALAEISADCNECAQQTEKAREIEADLQELETLLAEFKSVSPGVLISPFRSEAHSILPVALRPIDFFVPAVLALLLQHLAITFAALSIVRERRLGMVELFRVSPLSAAEALLGKYLSYFFFGGVLAAVLTGLVVFVMGVPMLGQWVNFAIIVAALLFTSLGIGFVISLAAETDSQAVQYSMLVLLASVFFGGLFVSQYLLWEPIRVISWLLPVTYGMSLLQGVMLRGASLNLLWLTGLLAIGLLLLVIASIQMRRLLAST
ncbi:MAG: ABC transporter permease [Anaerolineales bacterium]